MACGFSWAHTCWLWRFTTPRRVKHDSSLHNMLFKNCLFCSIERRIHWQKNNLRSWWGDDLLLNLGRVVNGKHVDGPCLKLEEFLTYEWLTRMECASCFSTACCWISVKFTKNPVIVPFLLNINSILPFIRSSNKSIISKSLVNVDKHWGMRMASSRKSSSVLPSCFRRVSICHSITEMDIGLFLTRKIKRHLVVKEKLMKIKLNRQCAHLSLWQITDNSFFVHGTLCFTQ